MAKLIDFFNSSASAIIKGYATPLKEYYCKLRKNMSSEKIAMGFDKQFWTSFKINMVCYMLSSMDWYKYLLEIDFMKWYAFGRQFGTKLRGGWGGLPPTKNIFLLQFIAKQCKLINIY